MYRISENKIKELRKKSIGKEKEIQYLVEQNLYEIFRIRFLASEYSTGDQHGGRMDSLGIDENNTPVIIEYKRQKSENIINQGLYYMNWLLDHKASFEILVLDNLGKRVEVDWTSPRILCIAEDYTKFDLQAIEQMGKNIELVKFQKFDDNYILFELLKSVEKEIIVTTSKSDHKTIKQYYNEADKVQLEIISILEDFIISLGDDVQKKELKYYWAYKRMKNFASISIYKNVIRLHLVLVPSELDNLPIQAKDLTGKGYLGTGDLQINISSTDEIDSIKSLIEKSYRES